MPASLYSLTFKEGDQCELRATEVEWIPTSRSTLCCVVYVHLLGERDGKGTSSETE